jgi:hypothetical protein
MKDVLCPILWMKDENQTSVIDKGCQKDFSSFRFISSTFCNGSLPSAMAHFLAAKVSSRLDVWKDRLASLRLIVFNEQWTTQLVALKGKGSRGIYLSYSWTRKCGGWRMGRPHRERLALRSRRGRSGRFREEKGKTVGDRRP